jgi:hypothetical protein
MGVLQFRSRWFENEVLKMIGQDRHSYPESFGETPDDQHKTGCGGGGAKLIIPSEYDEFDRLKLHQSISLVKTRFSFFFPEIF